MKGSVYDIFEDVNKTIFPGFDKALWSQCIQEQNEIIFVPSGWFHQVHNMEDTISINHNWFNAYNLSWVWDLLLRDYNEAKKYIEDIKDICDDFEGLCQRNLAANTGMNFDDFFIFIVCFSLANLVQLHHLSQEYGNHVRSSSQKAKHLAFNLESAKEITLKMKSMAAISNRGFSVDVMEIHKDPAFLQMCMVLGRTYEMLHDPYNLGRSREDLVKDIGHFNTDESLAYHVCNPETLASMIDSALKKLSHVLDVCESR